MTSNQASRRILKAETLEREFDKDIEEAKTLREFEHQEKKDSRVWYLTVLLILVLTLFLLFKDFDTLNLSPREFIANLLAFRFSALVLPGAVLLLGFCVYVLFQNRKIKRQRREVFVHKIKLERTAGTREEVLGLFEISSGVANHKDITAILEMVAREALNSLQVHRATVFLLEEKSSILKTQFTRSSDARNEQVGLFEEKEVGRKALRQRKPFLLRESKDFSEFFKYEERDRKITSLMSTPLISQGKGIGVLSVVILDEDRKFSEKDLQMFMVLANLACMAMENSLLQEEVRKGASFRKNYEQYLDHILKQLQSLSDVERGRIEDHIDRLLPSHSAEAEPSLADQTEELVKGTSPLSEPMAAASEGEDRTPKRLQVDMDGEPLTLTQDLGDGGVFIRTPNPLDLGEQFLLKLCLAEGEAPVEVTCKVIWTNKYGKESRHLRRGMGVKFLNLSPELQSRVERYIRSNKSKPFSFVEDEHHLSMKK